MVSEFNVIGKLYRVLYKAGGRRRVGQCLKGGVKRGRRGALSHSQAALPVDRQVQPVEGVERVGQGRVQLQLGQQGEVVRGDVRVGAARDVVVYEPLAVERSEHAQDAHVGLGEEDVVDHTLEVICVVGVRHQIAVVGALKLEAVCDASIRVSVLAVAVEVGQTFAVA